MSRPPAVVKAAAAPPRGKPSNYPPAFAALVVGRVKTPLGDLFGLGNFGVNLTRLEPGAISALLHRHSRQDEFVFVLEGRPTLVLEDGEVQMEAGDCAGFPAGGQGHQLVNRTSQPVVYLEIGDRAPQDEVIYPADDLAARLEDGRWVFARKSGEPY